MPAGGQVQQHTLKPLAIQRKPRAGLAGAAAERAQKAVGVGVGKAEIDAFSPLVIFVVGVDARAIGDLLTVTFPQAVSDRLFDRAKRNRR